jgi:hypothetical protein
MSNVFRSKSPKFLVGVALSVLVYDLRLENACATFEDDSLKCLLDR